MILEVHSTDIETGKAVAKLIVERINTFAPTMNRKFVIGLPTGNTPIPVYRELIAMCRNQEVSFEFVVTISLDEWLGLAADHPSSNACYMERELISQVDLPPAQTHLLAGLTPDPDYECARFEALISAHGGIHLLLCGIGGNGHLGLNEPGSGLNSRTRIVNLSPETRSSRAIDFGGLEQVPTHALTIGTGTICQAAEIILLATGDAKARSVRDSLQGPITHLCPASVLQLHPDVKVFTDVPAAELIDEKTREYLTPLPPPQPVEPALYSPSQIISRPTSPFALPVALTKSDLISPHSTTNIDFCAKVIKRRPGLRLITTQLPLFKRTSTDARAKGSRRRGSIGAGMLVVKEGDDDEDDEGPGWRR